MHPKTSTRAKCVKTNANIYPRKYAKILTILDSLCKNRKFEMKIPLVSSTSGLLMHDSWGKFSILIARSISFKFLELFLYSMLTEKDKNWFQLKYFRWKSSTFKIFTLLLHHKLVHQNNFVVQVIRFWKKNFYSFWIFKILTKVWEKIKFIRQMSGLRVFECEHKCKSKDP